MTISPSQRSGDTETTIRHAATERTVKPIRRSPTSADGIEPGNAPPATGEPAARPQVTPYVEPAVPLLAGRGTTPEPAPTVQVTIGRIEVRATPPPAPASRKQRPASPVMSLDEYLRLRDGGENR